MRPGAGPRQCRRGRRRPRRRWWPGRRAAGPSRRRRPRKAAPVPGRPSGCRPPAIPAWNCQKKHKRVKIRWVRPPWNRKTTTKKRTEWTRLGRLRFDDELLDEAQQLADQLVVGVRPHLFHDNRFQGLAWVRLRLGFGLIWLG